ncbi:hypothetical protein RJT34_11906 [Clitoria ternatea]|uniref:Zinc-ribbon domain-containing protein n=1 Tax=Clitoria ternatea TaxID=43366 RepID=A0AAN9JKT3_CLITE
MSGESAPKPRLVLCPKCRQLLREPQDHDVYMCGGCGTTLQAKKRKSKAVNSESRTHETNAASANALDPKADHKQYKNGEQLLSHQENDLKKKETRSSLAECSLDRNDKRDQNEDGECNGEQLVTSLENGLRAKAISSSPGECYLNANGGKDQTENGECNGEQPVVSQENGLRCEATSSSSGECPLNGNGEKDQIENGQCNGDQLVIAQENGLRKKETHSSSGECSLEGNGGSDQIENGECNGEKLFIPQENHMREKATNSSTGECSLNENGVENGEYNGQPLISQANSLSSKVTSSSLGESSLNGNGGRDQIENGEFDGEQLGQFYSSDELENDMDISKLSDLRRHTVSNNSCSDEVTHFEIEASAAELTAENSVKIVHKTNLQLEGKELSNGKEPLEGAREQLICALDKEDPNDENSALVGVKSEVDIARNDLEVTEELDDGGLLLEGAEQELISGSDGEVDNDKSAQVGANSKVDINGSIKAGSEELNNGNLLLKVTEEAFNVPISDGEDPKQNQSALVGAKSEVDIITGKASTANRLSAEEGSISCSDPFKLEKGTSGNHASSKDTQHRFEHVRSVVDTFDNTEVINPSLEIIGTQGDLSKYPTVRSFYAYDGSVSSNDGVDEQFPSQSLDSFENTYTFANGVSEGGSRKGKGLVDSMLYGDLESQHQPYFPKGKLHVPNDGRRNQNEVLEMTTRYGYACPTRTKKDEFPSRMLHYQSGSQSGYESGSPSNQMHDELYCSSSYLSPDSFEDPDQEKVKLLRMVYKLQDQLSRTSYMNGKTNGRLSIGNHISAYQSHDLHERRFYHGPDYPRCDGRCSHGINCCQTHNFSHVPYLAEPTSGAHHPGHSCFHCCPQEWQCSAELPPQVLYQHEELFRPHPGHSCCSSQHSHTSSPQLFMASKLQVHGREAKSCDQRHMAPEVNKYFREKPSSAKRHYRPVAGGAPFVTCHRCLMLLQLPADFLLFKRVYHQLKCGACQEVLKFSLQNRSHIISYAPSTLGLPSSDLNEVIDGSNPPSEPHANCYHSPQADHISYSDDYSHSVGKSYSSEGDPVAMTPSHPLHSNADDKPTVSSGALEPITEKEKTVSTSPSTSKTMVETKELAVNSSNLSSEMEARTQPRSSPLHQLMGYSSPSLMIRGVPSLAEGKQHILRENDPSSRKI